MAAKHLPGHEVEAMQEFGWFSWRWITDDMQHQFLALRGVAGPITYMTSPVGTTDKPDKVILDHVQLDGTHESFLKAVEYMLG